MLTLGLISLLASSAYSQRTDADYDWRDSSKIPTKLLPQQSEFRNNQYPYPAKPRSQWELGIGGGTSFILGDVSSNPIRNRNDADQATFGSNIGIGGTISLRKAISHTFSLRGGYAGAFSQGEPTSVQRRQGLVNYKNWMHSGTFDVIASLNPVSHYRGNPKSNIYVLAGVNAIASKTFIRANGGTQFGPSNPYATFYGQGAPTSTETGTLTTFGGNEVNGRKGWVLVPGFSGGAGIAWKLSNRFNFGLEQKFTFTGYDYLDGANRGKSTDIYSMTTGRLNFNLGSSARRVQPLWWLNPNNFIYNELNSPQHMKIPPPILPDADGDGVTDQFDMEPNTPQGAPVDVRGVAKDTDGDGVPDYKDKELLTPQKCFPVDADGVGTCPEPACCTELRNRIDSGMIGGTACNVGNLPSIQFRSGSAVLNNNAKQMLATAASQIKSNPTCRIKVVGYGASDKRAQQLSWDRVNAVIRYLAESQGVSEDRFIFQFGGMGDGNTVDLIGTTEEGPSSVPAPHPNLKK
ncbi:MAG: OmpA/MotB domain protein [Segetibacter sp.]|nr:OmpA/MotB domain protein [Segetibacter sp.]